MMEILQQIIIKPEISVGYLILINIITFIVYAVDKEKAKKHRWRIPEAQLIGLAAIGGALGALAAMKVFHHKTRHVKFYAGIPVIIILQIIAVSFVIIKY